MESVKDVFASENPRELAELNVTPELVDKIKNAFIALEELLVEAFPNNKFITRALTFLASYVNWYFK